MKAIDEMYCFVIIDDQGNEGIPALHIGGQAMPLVGADMARAISLIPIVKQMEKTTKRSIKLYKFSEKTEMFWRQFKEVQ